MVKTNKLGLIGRCFLGGGMFVGGILGGCEPLSNVQEQNLYSLTRLGIHHQEQKAMNEAIENSGTEVNVYVSGSNYQSPKKDYINAPQEDIAKAVQQRLKEIKEGKFKDYIDAPQEDIAKAVQQRLKEIKEGKFKN